MRETTKTVTFDDFTFRYSHNGQIDEALAITVREPNFDKRAMQAKMSALVLEAVVPR